MFPVINLKETIPLAACALAILEAVLEEYAAFVRQNNSVDEIAG